MDRHKVIHLIRREDVDPQIILCVALRELETETLKHWVCKFCRVISKDRKIRSLIRSVENCWFRGGSAMVASDTFYETLSYLEKRDLTITHVDWVTIRMLHTASGGSFYDLADDNVLCETQLRVLRSIVCRGEKLGGI